MAVPHYWHEGTQHLQRRDAVIAGFITEFATPELGLKKDAFTTLARAIAGQQISVKAADAVWRRVVTAAGGNKRTGKILPLRVLALEVDALRQCGLSERKVRYVRNLALQFSGRAISGRRLEGLDDHAVRNRLVQLDGIGPWTADMYLIFSLWRPNILPLGDLGLIRAIEANYCRGRKATPRKLRELQALWSPYATVAVWYLWRSLDPYPVEY